MNKKVIHSVFESIVAQYADRIAIESNGRNTSYHELNERANRIAHLLIKQGVQKGDVVSTFIENSQLQLEVLLAIFKAGGIYLPLDRKFKRKHWSVLLENIQPKVLLLEPERMKDFEESRQPFEYQIPSLISIGKEDSIQIHEYGNDDVKEYPLQVELSVENPPLIVDGDDSNYIFFTSGSSGKPKAVLGNHKSLSHFVHWESKELGITSEYRVAQLTSLSFDASLRDFFVPLMNGGTSCVPSTEVRNDVSQLASWIKDERITLIHTVPTLFRLLMDASKTINFTDLKFILLAGEKLYVRDIQKWRSAHGMRTELINLYGATESTLVKTFHRIGDIGSNLSEGISVGKPMSNTLVFIINDAGELCGIGEEGEIFIKTPFLSKGYFGEPGLTAEKFVQNPLSETPDIIYKTGDYGVYDSDRKIHVKGRKDGVTKISGVRIDINDIEASILECEPIKMVHCLVHQNEQMESTLFCFYVADESITTTVFEHCQRNLSQYEIPSRFIFLEDFPINANGKVDTIELRKILQAELDKEEEEEEPITTTEKRLAEIWKEVLGSKGVGLSSNFLLQGGNSIKLIKLKSRISREFNVAIDLMELFHNPLLKDQAALIDQSTTSHYTPIERVEEQESYAVSSNQKRMWLLSQFEESSLAYNMPRVIRLPESFDEKCLEKALEMVIQRHEILRTTFTLDQSGEICQKINSEIVLNLQYVHLENTDGALVDFMQKDSSKEFNLETGPLFRARILSTSEQVLLFYFNIHHIVCDEWSMDILIRDLLAYYDAIKEGKSVNLPELTIQFKDYAFWENNTMKSDETKVSQQFWLSKLEGAPSAFQLPFAKQRPMVQTYNGRMLQAKISPEVRNKLNQLCQENNGSLFVGLLSSWYAFFSCYSGQSDLVIGTPVSGRSRIELENQIGIFVNTLVLRNEVKTTDSFYSLLERITISTQESLQHQGYPFEELVNNLNITQDVSRNTLFDIMFSFQEKGEMTDEVTDYSRQILDCGVVPAKFDFDISFDENKGALDLNVLFNTDIYEKEDVERMIKHYRCFLEHLVGTPNSTIGRIDYLDREERRLLTEEFNDTDALYPSDKSVIELFQEHVEQRPDSIAVQCEENKITYQELDILSNQLAGFIQNKYQIGRGKSVGLKLERTEWMIVAMISILKTGGTYVPIDLNYPEERIAHIESDSNVQCSIDKDLIDEFKQSVPSNYQPVTVSNLDIAYVIYTSGSTGKPKGVQIKHESLVDYIYTFSSMFDLSEKDRVMQQASISFDISIEETFPTLCSGARLIVMKDGARDIEKLMSTLEEEKVTLLSTTPLLVNELNSYPGSVKELRYLLSGGEELKDEYISNLIDHVEIYNGYGPTEATVSTTFNKVEKGSDARIIGKPIANRKIYILNQQGTLQPFGIAGELCVSGIGLAIGYLNNPELTEEKFVNNPFEEGKKLYKTGDLAKWNKDGTIQFLGRIDDQVKIRGFRIELGEIESQLFLKPGVRDLTVLPLKGSNGNKELVAFLVSDYRESANEIRIFLKDKLPDYMIPTRFFQLDEMPKTSNGKINKKALNENVGVELLVKTEFVVPKTEEERVLVEVWQKVLNRDQVSVKDNFYGLGGDSIKSIQVISRLKERGYGLKIENVLRYPMLEDLAKFMSKDTQFIEQNEVSGTFPLTPVQHEFFNDEYVSNKKHYNQSVVLGTKEELNTEALSVVVDELVKHHDALRTLFTEENNGIVQFIPSYAEDKQERLHFFDLRNEIDEVAEMNRVGDEMQKSIDPFNGSLLKVLHFRLSTGDRIGIILHHLLIDGISWRILLEDVNTLYQQIVAGEKLKLPLKTHSYKDWAESLTVYANEFKNSEEVSYWNEMVTSTSPQLTKEINHNEAFEIDESVALKLSEQTTNLIHSTVNTRFNTEINDVLLAAFARAMEMTFGDQKIIIKMEGHGREEIIDGLDISRTIGWFTCIYPLVLDLSSSNTILDSLMAVKQARTNVPNKGIGYGILKYLTIDSLPNIEPKIVFNYLGDLSMNKSAEKKEVDFFYANEQIGQDVDNTIRSGEILHVSGFTTNNQLQMAVRYPGKVYDTKIMNQLITEFKNQLEAIAEYSVDRQVSSNEGEILSYNQLHLITEMHSSGTFGPIEVKSNQHINLETELTAFFAQFPSLAVEISGGADSGYRQNLIGADALNLSFYREKTQKIEGAIQLIFDQQHSFNGGFDLQKSEFIKVLIIEDQKEKCTRIFCRIHHALTDDLSNHKLKSHLNDFLNENVKNVPSISNFEYARAQAQFLHSQTGIQQRDYWTNKLSALKSMETSKVNTCTMVRKSIVISGEQFQTFMNYSKSLHVPIVAVNMAIHQIMLAKHCDQSAIIQVILTNGRENNVYDVDLDKVIGVVSDQFPVVVSKNVNALSEELIRKCHADNMDGRMNSGVPFEKIKEDVKSAFNSELLISGEFNFQVKQHTLNPKMVRNEEVPIRDGVQLKARMNYICTVYSNALEIVLEVPKNKDCEETVKNVLKIIEKQQYDFVQ